MTDKWHRRAGCGAGCVKIKVLMAIVTQVKQNAKNKNKVSVYADGEFLCSVTAESAVKLGVKAGAENHNGIVDHGNGFFKGGGMRVPLDEKSQPGGKISQGQGLFR